MLIYNGDLTYEEYFYTHWVCVSVLKANQENRSRMSTLFAGVESDGEEREKEAVGIDGGAHGFKDERNSGSVGKDRN